MIETILRSFRVLWIFRSLFPVCQNGGRRIIIVLLAHGGIERPGWLPDPTFDEF